MKKLLMYFFILSVFNFAHGAECGGVKIKSLKSCLKLKEDFVAISDDDENVRVDLIKNGVVVSSEDGHGYILKDFNSQEKNVHSKLIVIKGAEIVSFRTVGDKISFVYFYKVESSKLIAMPVQLKRIVYEPGLQINFSGSVSFDGDSILVDDPYFKAQYKIGHDRISVEKYIEK